MKIDATDQRILNQLQRRGKISNAELAEAANLSASACHRRVQRLEAEGVIKDYVCLLYTSPSPRDLSTSRMPSSA